MLRSRDLIARLERNRTKVKVRSTVVNNQLMPRKYERKTDRQSWSEKSMVKAIGIVLKKKMSYKKASKTYNVSQTTLEMRVSKTWKGELLPKEVAKKNLRGCKTVSSKAQETELVAHILLLEQTLFGLTLTDLRQLAFELAEKINIKHKFNRETKMAGKDWLYSIFDRHKNISLKKKKYQKENCPKIRSEKKKIKQKSLEEDTDESCIFRNELYIYFKSKERWVQCLVCERQSHEGCMDGEEGNVCNFCT